MIKRLALCIFNEIKEREWRLYKRRKYKRLKTKEFTIIGSNCTGAFMYYDLGLKYLTPTVNLMIEMNDFVKMAGNLEWYMKQELVEGTEEEKCPVGLLGDIKIHFIHYKSFAEGAAKWEERKQRIRWDNLFIVGSEKDGCTYETIKKFDELPYENKVIFTHVEYPEFPSAYCIRGFEDRKEVGVVIDYRDQFLRRRYLDLFDYVGFLNGKKRRNRSGKV